MAEWLGVYAGHDAGAAYVKDGLLIAATEEERISGQKHHIGFPSGAIQDTLALSQPGNYKEVKLPNCLLHDFFPDQETVDKKLNRYDAWGMPQDHPLEWQYAPPEPLPDWAK